MVCLTTALQIDGIRDNTLVKCQYFIYFQFILIPRYNVDALVLKRNTNS